MAHLRRAEVLALPPVTASLLLPDKFRIDKHVDLNFFHLGVTLNRPEFRFGEVLMPWTVIIGAVGFLTAWMVVAVLEHTGLSRYIWHLPLFFVALVVLFSSLVGMAISP